MAASVPTQAASLIGRAIAGGAEGLFSHPRARMADLRQPITQSRVNCGQQVVAAPTPTVDEDSELGTQAIPVDSTRFDDRWARIRRAPAMQLMQAQLQHAAVTNVLNERDTLDRVNLWVNRRIVYIADENNDRQRDYWATADETVARGSGDCEDFAILKMHMLRAAGIDEDRMKLVLLRDLAINADHALLLVRSNAGWVVLDNMTDRIYDGRQSDTMRPILSFSGNRRWVHGYRDVPASTARATFATGKAATGVCQRSTGRHLAHVVQNRFGERNGRQACVGACFDWQRTAQDVRTPAAARSKMTCGPARGLSNHQISEASVTGL